MIETRRQRIEMRMGERVCASGYVREWVRCPPPPPLEGEREGRDEGMSNNVSAKNV